MYGKIEHSLRDVLGDRGHIDGCGSDFGENKYWQSLRCTADGRNFDAHFRFDDRPVTARTGRTVDGTKDMKNLDSAISAAKDLGNGEFVDPDGGTLGFEASDDSNATVTFAALGQHLASCRAG